MNMVLDTGSANTAVISSLCKSEDCQHVTQPHLPAETADRYHDRVSASYGNAKLHTSWEGYATGQHVEIENTTTYGRVDLISDSHRFFTPRCPLNQGLWGLAYPGLQTRPVPENNATETLIDAIRRQHQLPDAFTFELCNKPIIDPVSALAFRMIHDTPMPYCKARERVGHFWLGGYVSERTPHLQWVKLLNPKYYEVKIKHFQVNDRPVQLPSNANRPRTIVDTGTNDIVLSTDNLQALLHALWQSRLVVFDDKVPPEHERAFWLDHARLTLPAHAVRLNRSATFGVTLADSTGDTVVPIAVENLLHIAPVGRHWVNISWTGLSHGGGTRVAGTILGNTLLRGRATVWDRGQNRLGFSDLRYDDLCCQASSADAVDTLISANAPLPPLGPSPIMYRAVECLWLALMALGILGTVVGIGLLAFHGILAQRRRRAAKAQRPENTPYTKS
ncbi:aspartic peptidase domain-containing protein [Syncephalastrum racemosum]|uniref:Aspartic peptidase domain-containing protein n=1 Tax=Syncephalastrum racemosum TaxID=13706 RepID=A0A1X2HBL7_SYNRA|nr:aspartic peptidase domain-containing protein [Syncephalastrum racemosum]